MSNILRSLKGNKKKKRRQTYIIVLLFLVAFLSFLYVDSSMKKMAVFETVSDSWEGDISIGGFIENGNAYISSDQLPSEAVLDNWKDLSLKTDIDGNLRLFGYAGPLTKPQFEWIIVNNIQHIDVNGDYLQSGTPSVMSQENGLLIETYYYTLSVQLSLFIERAEEHDYYAMNFNEYVFGCRYMYDVSPLRGMYLLPEIRLTPNNESITDMGSDLATYGGTKWNFFNRAGNKIDSSIVEEEFAENIYGFNRDFFMAGGDSGAGLNLYDNIDENTNQFTVGFVKVGNPGYFTGDITAIVAHTIQTTIYRVTLAIPLRMSVIVVYDIPYDEPIDTFYYGEEGSGDEQDDEDYWFTPLGEGIGDLQVRATEGGLNIAAEMFIPFLILIMVGAIIVIKRL
jgi:hypothetical protein